MTRYRLTVDVELDAQDPDEARREIYEHTEELRAALHLSEPDPQTADPLGHAFLDVIEGALRHEALTDGTPVLAPLDTPDPLDVVERRAILRALYATRGRVVRAVEYLRICRSAFYAKIHQHNIDVRALRQRGRPA